MSDLPTIFPGENRLLPFDLKQADGTTALLLSSLASAVVQLRQGDVVVATLTYGTDAACRQGATTSQLLVEVTSAVSAQLSPGVDLTVRLKLEVTDASFVAEPGRFKDWQDVAVLQVVS